MLKKIIMHQETSAALAQRIYENQYAYNKKIDGPYGERLVTYADYIASGLPLKFIENYIEHMVLPTYANTHTEASFTGRQTGHYREEARQLIKKSVNANDKDVLLFCGSGSTAAIDKIVHQFDGDQSKKPIIFLGPYEHHSNVLPWREGGFQIVSIPLTDTGFIDIVFLEKQLKEYQPHRTMIGSFSAASNVTGILSTIDEITILLHQYGAYSFWDYAAAAPYIDVDMNPGGLANKDAIFISAHKLIGGPGTPGILIAKQQLFDRQIPTTPGGGTVHFVTKTQQRYFEDIEIREEAGTPAIIESIRAGMVFKLKDAVGTDYIKAKEHDYITRAFAQFKEYSNIFILGNLDAPRLGFMAFHIRCEGRFLHHNFVVALLNDLFGIQARGGCSCAGPYGHDLLDLSETKSQAYMLELAKGNVGSKPGWVRLNFNYFIPDAEFQFIVDAIIWISKHGWKLLKQYTFDDRNALWIPNNKNIKMNSLENFIYFEPNANSIEIANKETERKNYFEDANHIATSSYALWNSSPIQPYHYDQIENPLRWYALAEDIVENELVELM
jgi:selenocysteine lyase/cysteine desulfurase